MTILSAKIDKLLRDAPPRVAKAFRLAVKDLTNRADMRLLREVLAYGGIEDAIRALNIDNAAFNNVRAELVRVYGDSGAATVQGTRWRDVNGKAVVVRWNAASPRAEAYARGLAADLITNVAEDTKEAVRQAIADGYAYGRKPNALALDLVGRINKATGAREGGIVGLSKQQEEWVRNMRTYLRYGQYDKALGMSLQDKGFVKALNTGQPLTEAQIDAYVGRYANKLMLSRGLTIGRTETARAVENGKREAWEQGIERTGMPESAIVRTWVHTGRGKRDRVQHVSMNGDQVRGLQAPFVLPDGTNMRHPMDTSLGAGASQIINCYCRADYKVDPKWRG